MKRGDKINRNRALRRRNEILLRKALREILSRAELSYLRFASQFLKSEIDSEWNFDWSEFEHVLAQILESTFGDGADVAVDQMGKMGIRISADFSSDMRSRAIAYAKQHGADLVKGVSDSIKSDMRDVLSKALEDGLSTNEFAKIVAERYAFSDERAKRIARTEMAFADAEGNLSAYKKAGVELKEWITAGDELVSEECQANAAQGPIPIHMPFTSGAHTAPQHPNCRCDVIPVLL